MTLSDVLNKLGIGNTEVSITKAEPNNQTPISEVIEPQPTPSSINELEKNKPIPSLVNEQTSSEEQEIENLRKEIADLKAANQQLLLGTGVQKQPTIEESILELAGLGGVING